MPSDMSLSDKPICTPPKRRYATRSATKSENSTSNKRGDHHSSSPRELNQLSKLLKSRSRDLISKNTTTPPSSPCELCQASDCRCAGTSRNPMTKKSSVQASLPGSPRSVSKYQQNREDTARRKSVRPKKRIVSASSQKCSQLPPLHSKKTKGQPSNIPCSSSQETTQYLKDWHTKRDSKLGNKTESSHQEPSPHSKDHRPEKTENSKLQKREILTPSSKPSEVEHVLGWSKQYETKKIIFNTQSLSKSMQPPKQQSAIKISKQSTSKNNDNVALSLRGSSLVSKSDLADQKGKAKLPEEPPQESFNKESPTRFLITWDGFEEPETEPCGWQCYLCDEDFAYSLDEEDDKALLPEVDVLPCGHAFHRTCLSFHTSETQYSREPKCFACLDLF